MMSTVAVLGAGAMGSRVAISLLKAGHRVTVWNRTLHRTHDLKSQGVEIAGSPRSAVADADYVISMVRDDDASQNVWLDESIGAIEGLKSDAVAIESSTLSIKWVKELAACCVEKKIAFLDAPVLGSRPQAEAKTLIHLVGGEKGAVDRSRPVLQVIGGAIHHVGPAGAGTTAKLAANALFGIQVAALAELGGLVRNCGIDLNTVFAALGETPVFSAAAKGAAASMLAGAFAPMFPVELVEKDFGYAAQAAETRAMPITAATRAVFQRAMQDGLGNDHLTGVFKLYA